VVFCAVRFSLFRLAAAADYTLDKASSMGQMFNKLEVDFCFIQYNMQSDFNIVYECA